MVVEQVKVAQTWVDAEKQSKGVVHSSIKDQSYGGTDNEIVSIKSETSQNRFEGLIHAGQHITLTSNLRMGRIEKLVPGDRGQVSYLVIRPPHFWNRRKLLPVGLVDAVNLKGVSISIDRSKFRQLPDYKTDAAISDEVETALSNDSVLRVIDYHEIGVNVKNGVVSLVGHVSGIMNKNRIENVVGSVDGILGVKTHLVADDKLLLKVAGGLASIEQGEENRIYTIVHNGIVVLDGKVVSVEVRSSAEQLAAIVPGVRGVINNILVPGTILDAESQDFIQPSIGQEIHFLDGLSGFVKQVVINRKNRRVVAIVIQGRFPEKRTAMTGGNQTPKRMAVIPVNAIRYITYESGFLHIASTETSQYQDFDPAKFTTPDSDWVPPYPYRKDDVLWVRVK